LEISRFSPRLKKLRKNVVYCHPEPSEGSASSPIPEKKQIPRENRALGMALLEFFRNLCSREMRTREAAVFFFTCSS
jgi:hypothetical protein